MTAPIDAEALVVAIFTMLGRAPSDGHSKRQLLKVTQALSNMTGAEVNQLVDSMVERGLLRRVTAAGHRCPRFKLATKLKAIDGGRR